MGSNELQWPQTLGEGVMYAKTEILRNYDDDAIGTVIWNVSRFEGTGENLPGWNTEGSPGPDKWNSKRGFVAPSVAANSLHTTKLKDNANAMDSLCDLIDPVATGSGDFHDAGGIRPYSADHRHCRGVDQNYSGPTPYLSLRLSIR